MQLWVKNAIPARHRLSRVAGTKAVTEGMKEIILTLGQPIFTAGRIRSNVRLAEAQQQSALLFYEQTIQAAFRSVSNALIANRKSKEFRMQEELLFQSAQDAARLSHMRYNGGVTGYLEVLTNETNAFSAELGLVQAQLNELLALVQVYQSLGGGWQ